MPLFVQITISVILGFAGMLFLFFGVRWLRVNSISKRLVHTYPHLGYHPQSNAAQSSLA
jgi:uncharacterized membrane protein YqiK